jgi:hypothetical protein
MNIKNTQGVMTDFKQIDNRKKLSAFIKKYGLTSAVSAQRGYVYEGCVDEVNVRMTCGNAHQVCLEMAGTVSLNVECSR